jgi:predicted PurR-regulated permease PerM
VGEGEEGSLNFGKAISFVIIAIALYACWQMRWLLLLLFMAIIFALALNMGVRRLQGWGIKRSYAVPLTVALFLLVLAAFLGLIVPPVIVQSQELGKLVPKGIGQLVLALRELASRLDPQFLQSLPNLSQFFTQFQPLLEEVAGRGWKLFYGSLGLLLSWLLLLVLTLMLFANPQPYRQGFTRLFPAFYRQRVREILHLCQLALQGWLAGIAYNMSVVGVLSLLGLTILRIPLALSQATIAGLLTFIPSLGLGLSAIPPLAISLLEEPWKPWAVLALYFAIYQVESHFLTPRILIPAAPLLPAITLVAQVFFGLSFGVLGLILAVPLTIVAQIWFREVVVRDILDRWQGTAANNQ